MKNKIFWLDTETTGFDIIKQDIVQLAYLVEIEDEIKEEGNIFIQPFSYENISLDALQVHGTTIEKLKTYQQPKTAYTELLKVLSKYIDKYDKTDKFQPAGYNARFDLDFLKQFFVKNNDVYFGSWFNYRTIDPLAILYFLDGASTISLPNYQLETVCGHFGIEIIAHDALSDIKATRKLTKTIFSKFIKKEKK